MGRPLAICAAVVALLTGCGHGGAGKAQSAADAVTQAVYNNDVDGVTSQLEDRTKTEVSRAEVGMLSDKMHALGKYKGLTPLSSDAANNEFTYRASFERGTMNVVVRLAPDDRLAAYRIFPKS
jgi:hypothetical protein